MSWMAWTLPTGIFFLSIFAALAVMTLLELKWPTQQRRGVLPLITTRGDRFFISLVSAAFIHLLWLGFVTDMLWIASVLAIFNAVWLMRWG